MAVTKVKASDLVVSLDGVDILCATSAELTIDREMLEAVCAASGNGTEYTPGRIDWSMSVDALFRIFTETDIASNVGASNILTLLLAGTQVSLSFGTPELPGGFTLEGEAYVNSFSLSGEVDGVPSWSAGLQGTGLPTVVPVV